MKAELLHQEGPIGHKCVCKEHAIWPAYIHAHWNDTITYTCDNCGQTTRICKGVATHIQPPKKRKK
jgi:hypothetical protein